MSLIGPRPDPTDWIDKYPDDIKVFLTVKPGLTGYSQAYYRNSADGNEKMKNDAYYAKHCGFMMDECICYIERKNLLWKWYKSEVFIL